MCHYHYMFRFLKKRRIYLDYAAATPVRKEVFKKMKPFFSAQFANPSAIHADGVLARTAIDTAREDIARVLHIRVPDVYFTASGTECNNLAILGTIEYTHSQGVAYSDIEIISTAIEHPSVSKTLDHLRALGVTVHEVVVDTEGVIDTQAFRSLLSIKTVLVTFAYANSEIGTVQPVGKIARIVRAFEKENDVRIYVHIDAAQAPLWLPCALDTLSVDMMSLDAGKCYGPKGVGVLALRHGTTLAPTMFGGGQERGLRPGTENTSLIVGAAEALCIAQRDYEKRAEKIREICEKGIELLESIEGIVLNGSRTQRIANNINVSAGEIDAEFAVITLDEQGISCSTKSACSGAGGEGSAVVRYISRDESRAHSTLRFTLGEETSLLDIETMVSALRTHIQLTKRFQSGLTIS